jgi:hypothetical protein
MKAAEPYYGIDVQYMNNGYDDMFEEHTEYPAESSDADLDNPVM